MDGVHRPIRAVFSYRGVSECTNGGNKPYLKPLRRHYPNRLFSPVQGYVACCQAFLLFHGQRTQTNVTVIVFFAEATNKRCQKQKFRSVFHFCPMPRQGSGFKNASAGRVGLLPKSTTVQAYIAISPLSSARNFRDNLNTTTFRGGRVKISAVCGLRPLRASLL